MTCYEQKKNIWQIIRAQGKVIELLYGQKNKTRDC